MHSKRIYPIPDSSNNHPLYAPIPSYKTLAVSSLCSVTVLPPLRQVGVAVYSWKFLAWYVVNPPGIRSLKKIDFSFCQQLPNGSGSLASGGISCTPPLPICWGVCLAGCHRSCAVKYFYNIMINKYSPSEGLKLSLDSVFTEDSIMRPERKDCLSCFVTVVYRAHWKG